MISTGWPEASLPATCGSDPIDLGPPFGGRQGTRLKMSVADFATSFTLSIALPVRLFCCAGFCCAELDGSTAATLPVLPAPVVGCSDGLAASGLLAASVLVLPDSAACWADCWLFWATCACTHTAGINSARTARAAAASDAVGRKGR